MKENSSKKRRLLCHISYLLLYTKYILCNNLYVTCSTNKQLVFYLSFFCSSSLMYIIYTHVFIHRCSIDKCIQYRLQSGKLCNGCCQNLTCYCRIVIYPFVKMRCLLLSIFVWKMRNTHDPNTQAIDGRVRFFIRLR